MDNTPPKCISNRIGLRINAPSLRVMGAVRPPSLVSQRRGVRPLSSVLLGSERGRGRERKRGKEEGRERGRKGVREGGK